MTKRYWRTPPEMYAKLDAEFGFDFDPCPCPVPAGFDGLAQPWGQMSYVNPPFRPHDGLDGKTGPTAFVHKALAEHTQGRGSVLVLPVQSYVMHLAAAGAEIRSMGRVKWHEVDTGEPMKGPSPICAFILRPTSPLTPGSDRGIQARAEARRRRWFSGYGDPMRR